MTDIRIGNGYDVHRLVENRKLRLGCVTVPYEKGLLGHSDADVLSHAICDALLGAAGLGDIGVHFPETDDRFEDVSGEYLLKETLYLINNAGFEIGNVDSIIIAQKPRLSAYIPTMKMKIASALGIEPERVNVKATTEEKLGFTGREEGIAAHAVCLLKTK